MNRFLQVTPLGTAALAFMLSACQQETGNPVEETEAGAHSEYALEMQKLKTGPEEAFESGLATLDARFGFPALPAMDAPPASGSPAMRKAAAVEVYNRTGDCYRVPKFVMQFQPGDRVIFRAKSLNVVDLGISDPVVMLIQFDQVGFKENGNLPFATQADFRILAWNDDVEVGNLTAAIDYTFKAGESGYFMLMAYPFSNSHSVRKASLGMDVFRASCPNCDLIIENPIRQLGGLVYKSQGANEFRANRTGSDGNPRLYVIMNSLGSGRSNGDGGVMSRDSWVYPYPVTKAEGALKGNIILIDNDNAGTASFNHIQSNR
jgi:hypothetical protein